MLLKYLIVSRFLGFSTSVGPYDYTPTTTLPCACCDIPGIPRFSFPNFSYSLARSFFPLPFSNSKTKNTININEKNESFLLFLKVQFLLCSISANKRSQGFLFFLLPPPLPLLRFVFDGICDSALHRPLHHLVGMCLLVLLLEQNRCRGPDPVQEDDPEGPERSLIKLGHEQ